MTDDSSDKKMVLPFRRRTPRARSVAHQLSAEAELVQLLHARVRQSDKVAAAIVKVRSTPLATIQSARQHVSCCNLAAAEACMADAARLAEALPDSTPDALPDLPPQLQGEP